jgi:hypothetical protein
MLLMILLRRRRQCQQNNGPVKEELSDRAGGGVNFLVRPERLATFTPPNRPETGPCG